MTNNLLTETLSEPLDGATTATVDIDSGPGNLTIDALPGDEPLLASGSLQYFEQQGAPAHSVHAENSRATLQLKGKSGGRPRSWLPWQACTGGTDWQIHLNPAIASDITAHTAGGNVRLGLADMAVAHLAVDTGGGNLDVVLPEHAANLSVAARTGGGNVTVAVGSDTTGANTVEAASGAGNVVVHLPSGLAARLHATSGLGKVIVDPPFSRIDKQTYQTPDFDSAADKVDIRAHSGAGNVRVATG